MAKVGDLVRYLNSVGGGKITRIEGNIAYVDEDGFETPVLLKECVVVSTGATHVPPYGSGIKDKTTSKDSTAAQAQTSKGDTPQAVKPQPQKETFVVEETPGGEKLNIVLGYEPVDIKKLSTTTFDTYLVNDSNYYLYFAYMTRSNETRQWTLRYSGQVEPGIQVFIGEVTREDLPDMDHVAIQYIAYKRDKAFDIKMPTVVDLRLDTTKFCKLHCFQQNMYFDSPVIALTIVNDDKPARQMEVKAEDLRDAMRQKVNADRRPIAKGHDAGTQANRKRKGEEPLVVDLHIAELVDTTAGLSNADMLNLQVETFRKVMDGNLKNHGRKIIFIHGKGDGVLRKALLKELSYRYKEHDVQDASFQEYGYGATQVRIK